MQLEPSQIRPERCEKIFLPLSPLAHGQIPDNPVQPISGERMTTFYSRDTVIDAFPQRLLSAFWAAATNPQTPLLNWSKRGTLRRAARPFEPFSCCGCEIYSECGKKLRNTSNCTAQYSSISGVPHPSIITELGSNLCFALVLLPPLLLALPIRLNDVALLPSLLRRL